LAWLASDTLEIPVVDPNGTSDLALCREFGMFLREAIPTDAVNTRHILVREDPPGVLERCGWDPPQLRGGCHCKRCGGEIQDLDTRHT
jgi:hypothetical protein